MNLKGIIAAGMIIAGLAGNASAYFKDAKYKQYENNERRVVMADLDGNGTLDRVDFYKNGKIDYTLWKSVLGGNVFKLCPKCDRGTEIDTPEVQREWRKWEANWKGLFI